MKIIRKVFTVLLLVILCTGLLGNCFLHTFNKVIINKDTITDIVMALDVSKEVKEVIDANTQDYLKNVEKSVKKSLVESAGGNKKVLNTKEAKKAIKQIKKEFTTVLEKFNTEENINKVLKDVINVLYNENSISLSTVLNNEIDDIIKNNDIKLEKETKKELTLFVSELEKDVYKELDENYETRLLLNKDKDAIINPIPAYINLMKQIELYIMLLLMVLVVIIIVINLNNLRFGIKGICIASLVSGILILLSTMSGNFIKSIISVSDKFAIVMLDLINTYLRNINMWGIIYFVIGVIGLILISIILKPQKTLLKEE